MSSFIGSLSVVLVLLLVCLVCYSSSAVQDCPRNFTLSTNREVSAIEVDTTASFCFILPVTPIVSCQLGDVLVNSPPEIVFNESSGEGIVMINDWDYVFVGNYFLNRISCDAGAPQQTYHADFYSLTAGSLTSNEVQPFYLEGAQVNVLCLNNNESPRFQGVPGWTNSSGDTVGVGDSLTFVATRELAGVYICSIPSATAIPSFVYEVVVHFAPEIISSSSEIVIFEDIPFTLECSYEGFPAPTITWTLNNSVVTNDSSSGISISMTSGSSRLKSNTASNSSEGTYSCVANNTIGTANITFDVQVAKFEDGSMTRPSGFKEFSDCSESEQVRSTITRDVVEYLKNRFGVEPLGKFPEFPAASCTEVEQAHLQPSSGLYWITQNGTMPMELFCDFE